MKSLKLLYGTAKASDGKVKKPGDIMEFEDDEAAAQMVSGAWEDVTKGVENIEKAPEKKK